MFTITPALPPIDGVGQCYSNYGPRRVPGRGGLVKRPRTGAQNFDFISYIPHAAWI